MQYKIYMQLPQACRLGAATVYHVLESEAAWPTCMQTVQTLYQWPALTHIFLVLWAEPSTGSDQEVLGPLLPAIEAAWSCAARPAALQPSPAASQPPCQSQPFCVRVAFLTSFRPGDQVSGDTLTMNLGYSHDVVMKIPKDLDVKVQTNITSSLKA